MSEEDERQTKPAPDSGLQRFSEIRASDAATLPTPPPPAGAVPDVEVDVRATGAREIVLPAGAAASEEVLDDEDIETIRPPKAAAAADSPNDAATRRPAATDADAADADGDPTPLYVALEPRALRPPRIPSEIAVDARFDSSPPAELIEDDDDNADDADGVDDADDADDEADAIDSAAVTKAPGRRDKVGEAKAAAPDADKNADQRLDASSAAPAPPPLPPEATRGPSELLIPTVRPDAYSDGGVPDLSQSPLAANPLTPPTASSRVPPQLPRAGLLVGLVAVSVLFGVWLGSRGGGDPAAPPEPVAKPLPLPPDAPPQSATAVPEPPTAAPEQEPKVVAEQAQEAQAQQEPAQAEDDAPADPKSDESAQSAATPTTASNSKARPRKPKGLTPEELAALPKTPSRDDVLTAMNGIQGQASACSPDYKGTAQVDLTVANTGRVVHVLVGGYFAGKPEGSCIARAVRSAEFPRFQQERFTIRYPLTL